MNVLLWFTVDLRVQANSVLTHAAKLGPVLPIYVVDPAIWASSDHSARQWDFIAESLHDLREDLSALGAPLMVRSGALLNVLDRTARRHGCTRLVCREATGTTSGALRDWAAGRGIELHLRPDGSEPDGPPPFLRQVPGVEPGPIPTARSLGLHGDPCPHRQPGGRRRAEAVLATVLARAPAAPSPLFAVSERSASRLSPYLAQGVISAAEVGVAVRLAREGMHRPQDLGRSLMRGLDRRAALDPMEPPPDDAPSPGGTRHLTAWRMGQTGLPFVDACLRYLRATGWLPDRARALVLAVACHHLRLDWRTATRHLAAMSTDHDPDILWPIAHRVAIGDGRRPARIPDPIAEGLAMDPAGALIRAWVPELKPVPDSALHRPWRWEGARHFLGRHYPEPLVDPATGTRSARNRTDPAAQLDLGLPCRR